MSAEEQLRRQIIEKAWADPEFKQLLLTDARKALKDAFQIDVPAHIEVHALEETNDRFYLVLPPEPSTTVLKAASKNVQAGW